MAPVAAPALGALCPQCGSAGTSPCSTSTPVPRASGSPCAAAPGTTPSPARPASSWDTRSNSRGTGALGLVVLWALARGGWAGIGGSGAGPLIRPQDSAPLSPSSVFLTEFIPLRFSGKSLSVTADHRTIQQSLNRYERGHPSPWLCPWHWCQPPRPQATCVCPGKALSERQPLPRSSRGTVQSVGDALLTRRCRDSPGQAPR